MDTPPKKKKIGLPTLVLLGALAGIGVGVCAGDYAGALDPIGKAYIGLLSICVYPYLVASLLHGLGKLDPSTAARLFRRSWFVYCLAWSAVLAAVLEMSAAFPAATYPAVLKPGAADRGVDLVSLLIPGNPFADVVQNVLPAIVVFAVLYGVAMQRVTRKDTYLELLEHVKSASITIWNWVVMFAPLGVFALFAGSVGTMATWELAGMLLYVTVFLAGCLILAVFVFPAVVSCMTTVGYREMIRELRSAFLLSLVTTLSVVALPYITRMSEKFAREAGISDKELPDVVATNVSIAYPFAQLGNLLVALFFQFCTFFYQVPLTLGEKLLLPILSLISTIGSPTATVQAVTFMAAVFKMPSSAENLYVATMTFTRYGQVVLSVMGFAFASVISTLSFYGKLRIRPLRLVVSLTAGFLLLGAVILGLRGVNPQLFARPQSEYLKYRIDADLQRQVRATVYRTQEEVPPEILSGSEPTLEHVRRTGILRVGYSPHIIPFSYFNQDGELVGHDIALMYRLARDINVELAFVPIGALADLEKDLLANKFDIFASGAFVTEERLDHLSVSKPYVETPVALLTRSRLAHRLTSRRKLAGETGLKVASIRSSAVLHLARGLFPSNRIEIVESYSSLLQDPTIDVAVWGLIEARAFALAYSGFTVVVPEDAGTPLLVAFLMQPGSDQICRYVDYWIDMKKAEGVTETEYRNWIEGFPRKTGGRRWCVLRDVLHWVE